MLSSRKLGSAVGRGLTSPPYPKSVTSRTPQFGQVFPLERAVEAYKLLEAGKNYGKVVLKIANS